MNFSEVILQNPILETLSETTRQAGIESYVVGGFVRDLLLKRPSKDIDVVCLGDGNGIALAKKFGEANGQHTEVAVFKNFGTAHLKTGGWEVEFVGARKESYRQESRKPVVENGTLEDDQNRRDFTINAMAISLNDSSLGELIDPFGGVQDLKRKLIRTPLSPEATFSDDPLRMMRAIRFASQLNFDIDPDTFDAIVRMKERISIVSPERVIDELNKIVLSVMPSYGFKLLYHCGLLQIIFPELTELQGVETHDGKGHKDNFYHTLQVLDNLSKHTDDLWLRWAALLHDIAKPATKRFDTRVGWTFHGHEDVGARMVPGIFRRMKLPMDGKMRFVQKLVRLHLRPIALVRETVTDSALRRLLFETGEDLEALMMLCRADITSKNNDKVKKHIENFNRVERRLLEVEASDNMRVFQPVVTGEVIMETFGLPPSRQVGEIKTAIREAILDGKLRNEWDEAYPFMLQLAEKMNLKPVALPDGKQPSHEPSAP